jgi:lysophospholipase L1-like esterase
MKTNIFRYLVLAILIGGCNQEFDEVIPDRTDLGSGHETFSAGPLDFTTFVAIGNSLTAGYQAGALFTEGQSNSLPLILSKQFARVGGGTFNQPTINTVNGYSGMSGSTVFGRLLLQGSPARPTPQLSDGGAIPNILVNPSFAYSGNKATLNNFAVPGIQVGQALIPETGDWNNSGHPAFNPYYARFASAPGTSTILGDALARNPTFFFFWLGNNDILGYAVGGASNEAIFTSEANFRAYYGAALGALTANPAVEGIVGNIPNVTSIPFFKLVPWNIIAFDPAIADDVANLALLQGATPSINSAFDGLVQAALISQAEADSRKITYDYGANPVLLVDEDLEDLGPKFDILVNGGFMTDQQREDIDPYVQSRQANSTDLLPLTAGAVINSLADPMNPLSKLGIVIPLADQYVLMKSEQDIIATRTIAFNNIIKSILDGINAGGKRVALFDANARLAGLNTVPTYISNVMVDATLAPPFGAFSEDGVHPNSRGYALAAYWIIQQINQEFGSNVPRPQISEYQGTGLPIN